MRSWQRIAVVGSTLLVAGAVTTVARPGHHHEFQLGALTVASIIFVGIGGSVLASALVARMVARQVFGIDIGDAVEALRGTSALVRSSQNLEITIASVDGGVRVTAEHRFDLLSARLYPQRLPFRLYTDVARWGPDGGGFNSIVEPDGTVLDPESLRPHLHEIEGKAEFMKEYTFYPRRRAHFVVETYGLFRPSDRLIWTVEHISSDFAVRIRDTRGGDATVGVKVNHHRAAEITKAMVPARDTGLGRIIEFTYLGEVLPYQGFELRWTDPEA
jgi:hypothetical protein